MVLPGIAFVAFSALASLKLFKCGPDEQPACFLLTEACIQDAIAALGNGDDADHNTVALLKYAVVVDFGSRMKSLKRNVKAYRDLSPMGNAEAGVRFVQSVLEWAHQVPGAAVILLPLIAENCDSTDEDSSVSGFLTTIQQRFRAETAGAEPIQDLSNLKVTIPLAEQMRIQNLGDGQEGQHNDRIRFPSIIQEYLGKPAA
ncbi:unnamed protein product [Cylindrotheca closterium]|uniref:Uncharacterized protein n=1 Tax=Cylindrotheca closterium TaxID=2856 RepID=A0AAD2FTW7_9STRA|nr:unnamed protein product [Cylindrotheca closterium]